MSKRETKQLLLEAGTAYIIEHGYHHSGLTEILAAAQVPKGSFYYYFPSKEAFGLQILTHFAENNRAVLQRFLDDEAVSPLQRLRRHFEYNVEYLASRGLRQGCLIGKLGQETDELNEVIRVHIYTILDHKASRIHLGLQK